MNSNIVSDLELRFGLSSFRPGQEESIQATQLGLFKEFYRLLTQASHYCSSIST